TEEQLKTLEQDGSVLNISVDAVVRASGARVPSPFKDGSAGQGPVPPPALPPAGNSGPGGSSGGSSGSSGPGTRSSSVGVAVIDSGLEPTADLAPYYFKDFVNGVEQPYDDYGHGTHVAGLIAGLGVMSHGLYHGVAPGVRVISLKVLDSQGAGRTSTIIQ